MLDTRKIQYKISLSRRIAEHLSTAADDLTRRIAFRIDLCNEPENIFIGESLPTCRDDRTFDAHGVLWSCGSRLCNFCVGRLRRRNGEILQSVIDAESKRLRLGYHFFYIVLTQPDFALIGQPLSVQRKVMYDAHRLFYQSDYWNDLSYGSCKTEEFTLGKQNRKGHYHYHFNLLAVCRSRIQAANFFEIREEWTRCLKLSFEQNGIAWDCPTADGLANVYVKKVVERDASRTDKEISRRGVILEMSKYVVKPQSWSEIPVDELVEVIHQPRFWRMFELYGSFKQTAARIAREKEEKRVQSPFNFAYGQPRIIYALYLSFGRIAAYGQTEFHSKLKTDTYFNNKEITATASLLDSDVSANSPPEKRLGWRERYKNLSFEQFQRQQTGEAEDGRKFRKRQLRQKYGFTPMLYTFDGECF